MLNKIRRCFVKGMTTVAACVATMCACADADMPSVTVWAGLLLGSLAWIALFLWANPKYTEMDNNEAENGI